MKNNKQNKYTHALRVICINMAAVQVVLVPVCKPMGNVNRRNLKVSPKND